MPYLLLPNYRRNLIVPSSYIQNIGSVAEPSFLIGSFVDSADLTGPVSAAIGWPAPDHPVVWRQRFVAATAFWLDAGQRPFAVAFQSSGSFESPASSDPCRSCHPAVIFAVSF